MSKQSWRTRRSRLMSMTGDYCIECGRYEEPEKLTETVEPGHYICKKCEVIHENRK
jgi:hypothetical protein